MSRRTSSRSIFTTSPSTMSPSLKSRNEASSAAISSSGVRSGCSSAVVGVAAGSGAGSAGIAAGAPCSSSEATVVSSLIPSVSFRHAGRFAEGVFGFASGAGREPRGPSERLRTLRERRQWDAAASVSGGRRLGPVRTPADVGAKGDREVDRVLHPISNDRRGLLHPVLRHLEHQLIVNGQQHLAIELRSLAEGFVHTDHRHLEDVAGAALDRGVEGLPFPLVSSGMYRRLPRMVSVNPSIRARSTWARR